MQDSYPKKLGILQAMLAALAIAASTAYAKGRDSEVNQTLFTPEQWRHNEYGCLLEKLPPKQRAIPDDVFAYLMERAPSQIIMCEAYLTEKQRRGYDKLKEGIQSISDFPEKTATSDGQAHLGESNPAQTKRLQENNRRKPTKEFKNYKPFSEKTNP